MKGINTIWKPEEVEIIMANYQKMIKREVLKLLIAAGSDKTLAQLIYYYKNHNLRSGIDMSFKKGNVPPLKGKKAPPQIIEALKPTMFKAGNRPHNVMKVGEEVINDQGYRRVKVAEPNKWEFVHHVEWRKHKGEIPKGCCIVFLDGNKLNCNIENLECITKAENCRMNNNFKYADSPEQRQIQIDIVKISSRIRKVNK